MNIDEWFKEVRRIYSEYYEGLALSYNDLDDWRDYYEDGYTPKEAINDEARYL